MAYISPEDPISFQKDMEEMTINTPAHADEFNKRYQLLLENDLFLEQSCVSINKHLDQTDENIRHPQNMILRCYELEDLLNANPIAAHNADPYTHVNMIVDGNVFAADDTSQTLEEHINNPNAHQNITIDGGEKEWQR